jgi:hypothetical protein
VLSLVRGSVGALSSIEPHKADRPDGGEPERLNYTRFMRCELVYEGGSWCGLKQGNQCLGKTK